MSGGWLRWSYANRSNLARMVQDTRYAAIID